MMFINVDWLKEQYLANHIVNFTSFEPMESFDGNNWDDFCSASSRCRYFTYFLWLTRFPNKGKNNGDTYIIKI